MGDITLELTPQQAVRMAKEHPNTVVWNKKLRQDAENTSGLERSVLMTAYNKSGIRLEDYVKKGLYNTDTVKPEYRPKTEAVTFEEWLKIFVDSKAKL